jgi:hypothetical protein
MDAVIAVAVLVLCSGAIAPTALAGTGSISGNVTGAPSHAAVPGVEVCALKTTVEHEIPVENKDHCDFTESDGGYEIGGLEAGTYLPLFSPRVPGQNYVARYYDADGTWPPDSVTVGDGPTTDIDTELPQGGTVKGQVTEELVGKPLAGVMVCAGRGFEHREPSCDPTDSDGRYEIVGLWTDDYTLKFSPEHSGLLYFGEYYENEIFGSGLPPTQVSVTAGSVTSGIDAALKPAAEVRGTVTAAANGAPLSNILVCAAPPDSFFETSSFDNERRCSRTNGSGAYAIKSVKGGQYKVLFSLELREYLHYLPPVKPEVDGYPTKHWNEKETLQEADVLTLNAPTVVTGIDARLGPPPPPSIISPPPPLPPPATTSILKAKIKNRAATFRFQGTNATHFECKLDRKPFRACKSPRTYRQLKPGKHRFAVRAVGTGGRDESPAVRKFKTSK